MISFKNKKVIIFDLDGTIVKLDADWRQLKMLIADHYTRVYKGENCEFDHVSACLDYVVEKNDEQELNNFFKIIEDYEMKNINSNRDIEETIFFINNLELFGVNLGTKLAIYSLNTRKAITTSLRLAKILEKFDLIVGREDIRKWKPNPNGLLKIQEHFNVKKEEMIYFGDLQKDIKTGNNAGVETYLIEAIINLVHEKERDMRNS